MIMSEKVTVWNRCHD